MSKLLADVNYVCYQCGSKYSPAPKKQCEFQGITVHRGECDVCTIMGTVYPIRHFQYLPYLDQKELDNMRAIYKRRT